VVLGTFILWVSWFFFNGGSTLGVFNHYDHSVSKIMVNTVLSACCGGLVAMMLKGYFVNQE